MHILFVTCFNLTATESFKFWWICDWIRSFDVEKRSI